MNICNICRSGINANGILRLPCGHGFHRWCVREQIECGRYHCAVESCEEPFFFVQLNRGSLGRRRVYVIPRNHLGNESQRAIKTLENLYNYNFELATIAFRTNVEEQVYREVFDMVNEIIHFDDHEGEPDPEILDLIDFILRFEKAILIFRVVVLVSVIACSFTQGFTASESSLRLLLILLVNFEPFVRQWQMHGAFILLIVLFVYFYLELSGLSRRN